MSNIVETKDGQKIDTRLVAKGCASPVKKKGAFFVFELTLNADDVREYNFTDRQKAVDMRNIMIQHLERTIGANLKSGGVKKT